MTDNLEIPPFLRRTKAEKPEPAERRISREAEQRREAHRIATDCRKLLEKWRRKKAREIRKRRRGTDRPDA